MLCNGYASDVLGTALPTQRALQLAPFVPLGTPAGKGQAHVRRVKLGRTEGSMASLVFPVQRALSRQQHLRLALPVLLATIRTTSTQRNASLSHRNVCCQFEFTLVLSMSSRVILPSCSGVRSNSMSSWDVQQCLRSYFSYGVLAMSNRLILSFSRHSDANTMSYWALLSFFFTNSTHTLPCREVQQLDGRKLKCNLRTVPRGLVLSVLRDIDTHYLSTRDDMSSKGFHGPHDMPSKLDPCPSSGHKQQPRRIS